MPRCLYPGALTTAIRSDDPERVRKALARRLPGALNRARSDGFTALGIAIEYHALRSLETLLELGADPNHPLQSPGVPTPLLKAIARASDRAVLTLLRAGACPNAHPDAWPPPLLYALAQGRTACAWALLGHGPDLAATTFDGRTALIAAVEHGDAEIVRTLLDRGSPVNARLRDSRTALSCAITAGHEAIVRLLLEHGANPCERILHNHMTPLHLVSTHARPDIAQILLDHGADLDALDEKGRLPETLARRAGRTDLAEFLAAARRSARLSSPSSVSAPDLHDAPAL